MARACVWLWVWCMARVYLSLAKCSTLPTHTIDACTIHFCTMRIASVYSGWNYVIAPMRVCVRRTEPHTWCRNAMWWFSNILNGDAWARANMDNRLKCAYEKVCHWTHLDRKCRRNKIFFRCSKWPPKQKQLKQLALEESTKKKHKTKHLNIHFLCEAYAQLLYMCLSSEQTYATRQAVRPAVIFPPIYANVGIDEALAEKSNEFSNADISFIIFLYYTNYNALKYFSHRGTKNMIDKRKCIVRSEGKGIWSHWLRR